MTGSEKRRTLAWLLAVSVPLGALIGAGLGWRIGGEGPAIEAGAVIGFLVSAGFVSFDAGWALGLIPRAWREAPFLVVLVTRSLAWLAIILVGIGLPLTTVGGVSPAGLVDRQFVIMMALCFVAALVFNFVGQVNRLLGPRVLLRLIGGRYHRPREEVRVFLLIDLRRSTQIAEKLGNLRYHAFLNRFIGDVTASVRRYRGEVHRYVGDEVILTWTAEEGLAEGRCISAVFAICDTLEAARSEYAADFGVEPSFWAGLHLGPVVTGEIGTVKTEIAFLGDALNTAARIQQASKDFQRQFLASVDVVSALQLPDGVAAESLGHIELRGIEDPVELFGIDRVAGPVPAAALPA